MEPYRPVARGGSGGSIEPPISGSVYCAVQSVHSMPHGFGRRQSSRIHNIEQCSAARLAAPRLHKRARRSERADVYNNISNITNVSHMMASKASAMDGQWRGAPA